MEEEALILKLAMEVLHFLQLTNSPMSLLAPQVPNLSGVGLALVSPPSCVVEEQEGV